MVNFLKQLSDIKHTPLAELQLYLDATRSSWPNTQAAQTTAAEKSPHTQQA